MIIRTGNMFDADALAELSAQTFYDTYTGQMSETDLLQYIEENYSSEHQMRELLDNQAHFIVIEIDTVLVGYAKLQEIEADDFLIQAIRPIKLDHLYLRKDWIGYGLGRSLMQACIDMALEHGYRALHLDVWENNHSALEFYKKWGFEKIGVVTFHIGEETQLDLMMRLKLA